MSGFLEPETFVVAQTEACFGYPRGRLWGPYVTLALAERQLANIHRHKGDGRIEKGSFGPPCRTHHPEIANY